MDPLIGYALLGLAAILLLVVVVRVARKLQIQTGDVLGVLIVGDARDVSQTNFGRGRQEQGRSGSEPSRQEKGRLRRAVELVDVVLSILVAVLAIVGSIAALWQAS